ncbi:MAG: DUF115 domain-containing protein [Treponema sp.]|nr:DUF115 domain-containing protein [Treponema sp.]
MLKKLSHWKANSTVLRKIYPGLLEELLRHESRPPSGGGEPKVETASSGMPTMLINGRYVHSPRDPAREGHRLAEACLSSSAAGAGDDAPVLVLGFGLGYAAEAITRLAPQRPLVIVEKNPGLLRRAFELRDFSRFLSRPGIAFVPGGEGDGAVVALSFFEKNGGNGQTRSGQAHSGHVHHGHVPRGRSPLILRNRTLTGIDEQWYSAAENRVRAWATQGDVNKATLKKFGRRWVRNLTRNMAAIRDLPGISGLAGLAGPPGSDGRPSPDGVFPVFLAAAGPGLDDVGSLLPEIRKRCIVVAVDTSLRFFSRSETEPDFVLVVDPQFWNSRHLDRCATGRRTRMIAESAVYPPALRLPFGGTFLCGSLFPLGAFIEKRVDPKGLLGAGGSVATSAWDFCRTLGAGEIWVAGLDLAFPGNRTHFKGAMFEEKALAESGRLKPAETFLQAALRSGVPFMAPSASGGKVLTDRRLSLYASWFENSFQANPGIRNYRLTRDGPGYQGGIAISGFEPAWTERLLALPERRAEIDARLDSAFSRIETEFQGETPQRHRRYEAALADLRSGLEKIKACCGEGERLAAGALRNGGYADRKKTLAALDRINRAIAESEVREIAGFLMPEEPLGEIAAPPAGNEAAFRGYLESSLRLYRALAEATGIDV